MKSAVKAKLAFLTVIGAFLLPVLLPILSKLANSTFRLFGIKKSTDLWNEAYRSIIRFWEFFFTKESYPPPSWTHFGYHSQIVIEVTDLTVVFICGLISYLLAKSFIKDEEAENLSIC